MPSVAYEPHGRGSYITKEVKNVPS
jgi:hypothetical protein